MDTCQADDDERILGATVLFNFCAFPSSLIFLAVLSPRQLLIIIPLALRILFFFLLFFVLKLRADKMKYTTIAALLPLASAAASSNKRQSDDAKFTVTDFEATCDTDPELKGYCKSVTPPF